MNRSRNIYNIIRYGWEAPRFGEIIWVSPSNCNMYIPKSIIKESCGMPPNAALVIKSTWLFEQARPINEISKLKYCIDHWVDGIPWENTDAFEYTKYREESLKKHKVLDLIFEQVKREGSFRLKEETISSYSYRPYAYAKVHIGPNGEAFYGGDARHRFAMAHILQIPFPAQIGCVHVSAIPYLKEYRRKK